MKVTHEFVSPHSDGSDDSQVQPSSWNADHTIIGSGIPDTWYVNEATGELRINYPGEPQNSAALFTIGDAYSIPQKYVFAMTSDGDSDQIFRANGLSHRYHVMYDDVGFVPMSIGEYYVYIGGPTNGAIFAVDTYNNLIALNGLPTSDPNVSNTLWNDNGTVKLSGSPVLPIQAVYGSTSVSVEDNAYIFFSLDTLVDGTDLFDRTTPNHPLMLATGFYAFTATVNTSSQSDGGNYGFQIVLEEQVSPFNAFNLEEETVSLPAYSINTSFTIHVIAGTLLRLKLLNHDGQGNAHFYTLTNLVVVRLA